MNAMQPPQSIEEIKAGLETTEKGGVRQSIRNCLTVFQRDPLLSGAIAYNILTDRKDIIKPIGFHRESTALNDTDMKYLLLYLEETYGLTNEKKIDNAIGIVANENKYHPIRDYLNTLVWDGTERIRFCLRHFLGADADDYTYEALKLFLLGAISRAFQPGCKFEIMLCLVGGQGAGKSTFFRLLAVRDEWFSDDLRKLDDDNVYRKLQGHWIIEMSEMMATANAKSIEEIKSFLSRQKEVYKIPYETHPADRPRQCVFGGTSNALDFLPLDRSGNRRFIPVMVYPEQAEVHILEDEAASRAYIEQMWAEAMEIYRSGRFKLAFSPAMQRYLKEHQRDFMPEDTKAGMIQAYLDKYTGSMVCSKQLYKEAFTAKAKTVLSDGWKGLERRYRATLKTKPAPEDDGESGLLPGTLSFTEGQTFDSPTAKVTGHDTTPPKPHNEASLLSAMECAGNEETDPDAERRGLGTPATRAAVIEKLVKGGFVERKGKQLIPTKDGINLVCVLPEALTSPKLTAEWENNLTQIAKGKADPDAFMGGIEEMAKGLVKSYPFLSDEKKDLFKPERAELGKCPRCGSPVYEGKKNYYCSNKECNFTMWKNDRFFEERKVNFSPKIAAALLKDGKATVKKLYSPKTGKTYEGTVLLADTGGKYVNYRVELPKKRK